MKTLLLIYKEDIQKALDSSLSIGTMRDNIKKIVKKAENFNTKRNNSINKAIKEGKINL